MVVVTVCVWTRGGVWVASVGDDLHVDALSGLFEGDYFGPLWLE